jgi:hypothetical protein
MSRPVEQTPASVFRTEAWVQAWIDTWGADPRIRLIDLGGRKNPLEHVYITKHWLKNILPVNTLCLAGTGYGAISTPRAEYNDISALLAMAGSKEQLVKLLAPLKWQQFVIPDVDTTTVAMAEIEALVSQTNWRIHTEKTEPAYSISPIPFDEYLKSLGANTRLAYFNRRDRLAKEGEIGFINFKVQKASQFLQHLNQFHIPRWGSPCYSKESQAFIQNFAERLTAAGGEVIMQGITVNGELVSVLLDLIWGNTRYNLQSGYAENRFKKIALGSLHFGYAIQASLEKGLRYDFMAGDGKNGSYKRNISTHRTNIKSLLLQREALATLRSLAGKYRALTSSIKN